jgi:hypothetical protein
MANQWISSKYNTHTLRAGIFSITLEYRAKGWAVHFQNGTKETNLTDLDEAKEFARFYFQRVFANAAKELEK